MISHNLFENVSRETNQKFFIFEGLLKKWNQKVNLVSSNTLSDFMVRHVLDSLQLVQFANTDDGVWLDIGSGGGFPGIPLAIYSKEKYPKFKFKLMDSNSKKCHFLENVCENLNIEATVICGRMELAEAVNCDYIVSRAVAPLNELLEYSRRHRKKIGKSLFLKGKNLEKEISVARKSWIFNYRIHKSVTHGDGKIIEISQHNLLEIT